MTTGGALLRALALAGGLSPVLAGAAGIAEAPPGASSCSGCHGIRAGGSAVPPIHGRPADELADAMAEYRAGKRPATVMSRIATGFSAEESRAIAVWLSHQAAPK